jgi:hypothetical protein
MFAALRIDSSSDDEDSSNNADDDIIVPDYEDLSSNRADEVTVLEAVYGSDFSTDDCGAWNVRAMDQEKHHALILRVKPNQRYPYVVPKISVLSAPNQVSSSVGGTTSSSRSTTTTKLRESEERQLLAQLQTRAGELAETGSVMMIELVQVRCLPLIVST